MVSSQPCSDLKYLQDSSTTQSKKWSSRQVRRTLGSACVVAILFLLTAALLWNDWNAGEDSWWRSNSNKSFAVGRYLQPETEDTHDPLFPLSHRDYLGLLCTIMGLVLAAGGGIGGGGILVPLYILILGFPAKHAIPLSNVTVFGGAVANTLLNSRKRHPLADRPLIDWDLMLVMEPLTIAGALMGANLNKLLPQAVIVILLVVLLSATAYKTLDKARKMYEKESAIEFSQLETDDEEDVDVELTNVEKSVESEEDRETPSSSNAMNWSRVDTEDDLPSIELSNLEGATSPSEIPNDLRLGCEDPEMIDQVVASCPLHRSKSSPSKLSLSEAQNAELVDEPNSECLCVQQRHFSLPVKDQNDEDDWCEHAHAPSKSHLIIPCGAITADSNPLLEHILEEERHTPIRNVITIVALFLVVLNINIIKGGGAFSSPIGIECGSLSFWLAEAFMVTCIFFVSVAARVMLVHRTQTKEKVNYPYVEGDIEWTPRNTLLYPAVSCTAGFVAGLFGIGGGIVKGPLMLQMGVHPAVASATSACMILFTSFTATTSFVVFGLLVTDYAVALLLVGFFATLLGQTVMSMLLKKYRRNSYIAFSIGAVVVLSAVLLTVESLANAQQDGGAVTSHSSGGLCGSKMGE